MRNNVKPAYVHHDRIAILRSLFGLKDIDICSVSRNEDLVEIAIEHHVEGERCRACGGPAQLKDRSATTYVDLPCFGEPARVIWWKHRFRCPNPECSTKSWSVCDHRIAAKNFQLTTRCAKWATEQVGKGRSVDEVAAVLVVSQDGQRYYAWRRTISGWCFAIGADDGPPSQWLYDGPDPRLGFPGEDTAWDDAPHEAETSRNWT